MADNIRLGPSGDQGDVSAYVEAADDISSVWYRIQKLAFGGLGTATLVSASDPLPVTIISGSGGTEYTEDAAAAANPVGHALIVVRDDARGGSLTTTDGDNVALRGTNAGELYVKHVDSLIAAGDVANDGIDSGNPVKVGGKASTSAATSVAAGDRVDLNLTTQGAVILGSVASMTDAASAAPAGVTLSNSSTIRPLGAAMYIFNGTGHDRAPGNATDGLLVNLGANNDVSLNAGTNAIGKLAANSGVDIGDVDVTSVVPGTGATNLGKAEDGAHSTGDTGVMLLGVRTDTPNAARADTDLDYTPIATYRTGAVRTAIPEEDFAALGSNHVKKYYTNAGAVTDGIIWSPAAGKRWYVTDLIINTSAAATVTLEDDLAAGDAVVAKFELAANSGIAHRFATPLFSGEDAADLLVTTSAGNIYITCVGYEI